MQASDDIKTMIDGLKPDDISKLLDARRVLSAMTKDLDNAIVIVNNRIKIFLKERRWTRYLDPETDISVSLITTKRNIIDMKKLKFVLTESQLAQVTKVTTHEQLNVNTKETRERLSKYVKPNKKKSK